MNVEVPCMKELDFVDHLMVDIEPYHQTNEVQLLYDSELSH